ncbi:MAG: hypothetical protein HZC48_11655 [Nitrospirae bacterium]|nr:hypothetical protein [Nitrospirota bacterium]
MRIQNASGNGYPLFIKGGRSLSNERGIALLMVLVLTAISLAVMAGMIYMITQSTIMSGVEKRYATAIEAGKAGSEVTYDYIGTRGSPGIYTFSPGITEACRTLKLNQSTSNWAIGTTCPANSDSVTIDPLDDTTYDWSFELGTAPLDYSVFAKIVDTVEGNSAADEGLIKTGVILPNSGEIQVQSIPYIYSIEVHTENSTNSAEEAKLSVLYQY